MDWFTQLERAPLDLSALFVLFHLRRSVSTSAVQKKQIVRQNHFQLACHGCIGNRVELK